MKAERARNCYIRWLSGEVLSLADLSVALAWRSTIDASLAKTHDGNIHAVEYGAALKLIHQHAELWCPGAEVEAKTTVNAEK